MPYKVRKGGEGCAFEVVKENADGTPGPRVPGGCHSSQSEADRHSRALYAHEGDTKQALTTGQEMDVALGLGLFDAEIAAARVAVAELVAEPEPDGAGELVPQPGEHFHAVMHRQGKSTGRRTFTNLKWREPPFAYHWQKGSSAHGGTPLTIAIGLVNRVVPVGDDLHAFGPLDLDSADGREYGRRLASGFERWVSIGLDEQPYTTEEVWPEGDADDEVPGEMRRMFGEMPEQVMIDGGTIGELTGTSIPAQADAEVEATPELVALLEGEQPDGDAAFPPGKKANPFKAGGDRKTDDDCPDGQHLVDGECVPMEEGEEASVRPGDHCVDCPAPATTTRRAVMADGTEYSEVVCDRHAAKVASNLVVDLSGDRVTVRAHVADREIADLELIDGELWVAWEGDAADKPVEQQSPAQRKEGLKSGERFPMHNCGDVGKAIRAVGRAAGGEAGRDQVRRHIVSKARSLGCSTPDNWNSDGTLKKAAFDDVQVADLVEAVTAAAHRIDIPDLPPAAWFDAPTDVEIPGAFCITDAGRIYGILAPLHTGHRAFAQSGRRLTVPHGNVDLSRWMGGEAIVRMGDGRTGRIAGVGPITIDCGHASRFRSNHDVAPAHYENACTVFAKARAGETPEGLTWVAGALEPGVTPAQLSRALVCRLSGDWQPHPDRPGWDELVAALLVPAPAFAGERTGPTVTRMHMADATGRAESYEALVASSVPVRYVGEPVPLDDAERAAEFERVAAEAGSTEWAVAARRFNQYARAH
jgi:hypothetical protein